MTKSLLLTLITLSSFAHGASVNLSFSGIKFKAGNLNIAVFDDAKTFPDKKPILVKSISIAKDQTTAQMTIDLPEGDYAISAFADENKNGKLDLFMGKIPKEPFGFSKNPPIIGGAPRYSQCEIKVEESNNSFAIKLNRLPLPL